MLQSRLPMWDELFVKQQEELQMAATRAAEFQGTRSAPNTLRAYASDWREFETWCRDMGKVALPADPDTVVLYLSSLVPFKKCATLVRRAAAISYKHNAESFAVPDRRKIRSFLAGAKRKSSERIRQKAAITIDELKQACEYLRDKGGIRAARDRAAILLGFSAAFRRSDISFLDLGDISLSKEEVRLTLLKSKTDQEGKGRDIVLPRAKRAGVCVVRALTAWIAERGKWKGPLFCNLTRRNDEIQRTRMAGSAVYYALRTAAEAVGLDHTKFGAHSLRAGAATAAANEGEDVYAIMSLTGHKSAEMVARYVRRSVVRYPLRNVL